MWPKRTQQRGCRLGAESGESREAVGAVTHEGEPVGNRLGRNAELLADAVGVEQHFLAPIELEHLAADALTEVLVGRADDDLVDPLIGGRDAAAAEPSASSASSSTIGHTATPRASKRLLEQRELREQQGIDPRAVLYVSQRSLRNDSMT